MRRNWWTGWATASGCPGYAVCCRGKAGGRKASRTAAALDDPDRGAGQAAPWPSDRFRPVRLLSRPEPITSWRRSRTIRRCMFRWRDIAAQGRPRRRAGAHRAGMVARRDDDRRLRDYYRVEDEAAAASGSTARAFISADARAALVHARGVRMTVRTVRSGPAMPSFRSPANFSFLRGASQAEELVLRAAALGHAASALTDRNTLAGVVRACTARPRSTSLRLLIAAAGSTSPTAARPAGLSADRDGLWPAVPPADPGQAARREGRVRC